MDQSGSSLLRRAISDGEIIVHYQPQVDASTGTMVGVESLVRWQHPERGLLGPEAFLPLGADNDHTTQLLFETVLRQACRDAAAWANISIGVNVSPVQFQVPDLGQRITAIALAEGLPLNRLEIEVLETAYFEEPTHMHAVLKGLRAEGVQIALDDFGTGYASLAVLLELPLDKLKIDRGFVAKSSELKSASIIHAIVALARAIGFKVTAEGVETEEQRLFLRSSGCHTLQGYLFSKPVPASKITELLENGITTG